jgi:AbrB family looped-hinge helix DNA binding protein
MAIYIPVAANGRISLPADVRKRLGVFNGGELLLEETENGVILRTVEQAVAYAQALTRQYTAGLKSVTVDDFLAQRRSDWGE